MSVVIMTPSSILSTQELHVLFNQDLMPLQPKGNHSLFIGKGYLPCHWVCSVNTV